MGRFEPAVDIAGLESPSPLRGGPGGAPGGSLGGSPGGRAGGVPAGGSAGTSGAGSGPEAGVRVRGRAQEACHVVDLTTPPSQRDPAGAGSAGGLGTRGEGQGGSGVSLPARDRGTSRMGKELERAAAKARKERERAAHKAQKERERVEAQAQRRRAREQARAEREHEAAAKRGQREMARRLRGKDCNAGVCVLVSPELLQMKGATGTRILELLKEKGFAFQIQSELANVTCPRAVDAPARCSLRWRWKLPAPGGSGDIVREVPHVLYFFEGEAFVTLVEKDDLNDAVRTLLKLSRIQVGGAAPSICLLVEGLESAVRKRERTSGNVAGPVFSRTRVEKALADLIVDFRGVTVRPVIDASEAADHVAVLTKTIAMAPYKAEDEYTDYAVKVDIQETVSKGLGMETWMRWLRQIPLGQKAAEAVAMEYPSISALLQAYSTCDEAAQKVLLQNLLMPPDRRRRVGRQASEQVWRFFNSVDPDEDA